MQAFCYILYSNKLDRFYIGSTELPVVERLRLHLTRHYGATKYTAKADDWIIYHFVAFDSLQQARKAENYLKRMRNRNYYNLLRTDELAGKKIVDKFS